MTNLSDEEKEILAKFILALYEINERLKKEGKNIV